MLDQYGPLLIFAAIAIIFPLATLWVLKFLRPTPPPNPEKLMPYECGITPESDARGRYTVRFYLIAILFVVFDVELLFLYPWATIAYEEDGLPALMRGPVFATMLVFLATLAVAYVYAWRRGVFKWR